MAVRGGGNGLTFANDGTFDGTFCGAPRFFLNYPMNLVLV